MHPPRDWLTPRLLTLLLDRAGTWVRRAEIDVRLGTHNWHCALAELREQQGYRVLTTTSHALATLSHINLIDKVPTTEFPDDMSYSLKHRLGKPGKLLCKICGRTAGDPHPYWVPGKVRLHARFKVAPERGRGQVKDNVEALCSVCRDTQPFKKAEKLSFVELRDLLGHADDGVRQGIHAWLSEEYCPQRTGPSTSRPEQL